MDDIVKLFNSQQILTDDDVGMLLFCPSDYLKRKLLLRHSMRLKLSVWEMICDVLPKSMRHVGNQLIAGKLFLNSFSTYINMYTYVLR